MSASSIAPSPPQSEVDVVDEILDQFYFSTAQENGNAEEREDVCFYNLYDHRTPRPYPKSPDSQYDSPAHKPFDQDLLVLKLKSCMASVSPGNKVESRVHPRGVNEYKEQGSSPANGAVGIGPSGATAPAAETGDNRHPAKNE